MAAFLRGFQNAHSFWESNRDTANAYMAAREGLSTGLFDSILTYDVKVLGEADQLEYLRPKTGRIEAILRHADDAMRRVGGLSGPDVVGGAWTDEFHVKP